MPPKIQRGFVKGAQMVVVLLKKKKSIGILFNILSVYRSNNLVNQLISTYVSKNKLKSDNLVNQLISTYISKNKLRDKTNTYLF